MTELVVEIERFTVGLGVPPEVRDACVGNQGQRDGPEGKRLKSVSPRWGRVRRHVHAVIFSSDPEAPPPGVELESWSP